MVIIEDKAPVLIIHGISFRISWYVSKLGQQKNDINIFYILNVF